MTEDIRDVPEDTPGTPGSEDSLFERLHVHENASQNPEVRAFHDKEGTPASISSSPSGRWRWRADTGPMPGVTCARPIPTSTSRGARSRPRPARWACTSGGMGEFTVVIDSYRGMVMEKTDAPTPIATG